MNINAFLASLGPCQIDRLIDIMLRTSLNCSDACNQYKAEIIG
jgi:hypothetical protein